MPESTHRRPTWRRPRNIVIAIVLIVLSIAGWYGREVWRVYKDAPEPGADYRAQILDLCAAAQPGGEDGWFALTDVLVELSAAAESARGPLRAGPNASKGVQEAGLAAMDAALDDQALRDELGAALAMPRFVRPWASNGSLMNELLPLLMPTRELGEVLNRKMRKTAEQGEWSQMIEWMRLAIRLGEVTARQPSAMHARSGAEIQRNTLETARAIFNEYAVPPDVAARIAEHVASIKAPDVAHQLEVARLSLENMLHWTHGSRGYALPLVTLLETDVDVRPTGPNDRTVDRAVMARWELATREECSELAEKYFKAMNALIGQPFSTRWQPGLPPEIEAEIWHSRFVVLAMFLPNLDRFLDSADAWMVERDATLLMAAIEQYAAKHGAPPASLDELAPEWIDQVPSDRIHGGAFGYTLLKDDPGGRAYRLYSFGPDGEDNGGASDDSDRHFVGYRIMPGTDAPFN